MTPAVAAREKPTVARVWHPEDRDAARLHLAQDAQICAASSLTRFRSAPIPIGGTVRRYRPGPHAAPAALIASHRPIFLHSYACESPLTMHASAALRIVPALVRDDGVMLCVSVWILDLAIPIRARRSMPSLAGVALSVAVARLHAGAVTSGSGGEIFSTVAPDNSRAFCRSRSTPRSGFRSWQQSADLATRCTRGDDARSAFDGVAEQVVGL